MKTRLKTFTGFVKALLPAEITYLESVVQFQDETNQNLFNQIVKFKNTGRYQAETDIDKRKYTYIKNWITTRLDAINVDKRLEELLKLEKKVMTDQVIPGDEKQILKLLKHPQTLPYYFTRIYELARDYRSFLLVRMRYQYLSPINEYLDRYHRQYQRSREVFDRLDEATRDITNQYTQKSNNVGNWESYLKSVFFDHSLDGLNRYYAIVRLTFLYYNNNELEKIEALYDYLDQQFKNGYFYSRRILANYYSNRLLLHAKMNQNELAEKYGYLSLRNPGSDYIHYLNNLASVLLRAKKSQNALELMQSSIPELKKTMSYHNRVGFAALFIRSLVANNKPSEAESYGTTFFAAYKSKVLEYRWHSFFSAWLQSMLILEDYRRILTICRRYKIMDREKQYSLRPRYIPTIAMYYQISRYKTGEASMEILKQNLHQLVHLPLTESAKNELLHEISQHLPFGRNWW